MAAHCKPKLSNLPCTIHLEVIRPPFHKNVILEWAVAVHPGSTFVNPTDVDRFKLCSAVVHGAFQKQPYGYCGKKK